MSSIGPIPSAAVAAQLQQEQQQQATQEQQSAQAARQAAEESAQLNEGNFRNQQNPNIRNQPPLPEFPQDEVKVQWDNPMTDRIEIYQFVNQQSGSLILQVPSPEVLGLAHEIQQELTEEASKAAASAASEGGKE